MVEEKDGLAVFLGDGKIVHDMSDPNAERILDRIKTLEG